MLLNGSRLGFYEPIRTSLNSLFGISLTEQVAFTSITAGAASGAIGGKLFPIFCVYRQATDERTASLGNPFFLIKARMQVCDPFLRC